MPKTMTALRDALSEAGVTGDPLYVAAAETLGRYIKDGPESAVRSARPHFAAKVMKDADLLVRLISEDQIQVAVMHYLRRVVGDMQGKSEVVGHQLFDAHQGNAPASGSTDDGAGGQSFHDAHLRLAPAPSSHEGGEGQAVFDAQEVDAPLPSPSRAGGGQLRNDAHGPYVTPAREPRPRSPKSLKAASQIARRTVFDTMIGKQYRYGALMKPDVVNLRRKHTVEDSILLDLERLPWPDDKTPLEDFVTEQQAKRIMMDAELHMQRLAGVTHA